MYQKRSRAGGGAPDDGGAGAAPGKRSLTQSFAPRVQAAPSSALIQAGNDLTAGGTTSDPEATARVAAQGVAGASGRLPHHDAIQASFGHHELGGLAVARDGAASGATEALGARAYAYGDRIALPQADLWTEAHEAAHVIQQRSGRVAAHGTPGDAHERHADAVADRVVAGESAAELLDEMAGDGGLGGEALQCFNTQAGNIVARWGYAVGGAGLAPASPAKLASDGAFAQLQLALAAYEVAATIATSERVLDAATAFVAAYGLVPDGERGDVRRITNQATTLVDQANRELDVQLRAVAQAPILVDDDDEAIALGQVDQAIGQLSNNPERRRERKRILKHQGELGMKATELGAVNDSHGPAILQSWRARGDMYHVGAVLNLFPQLRVILYDLPGADEIRTTAHVGREHERAERWEQASMIADYYGQPDRVFYTRADGVSAKASKGHAYDFKTAVDGGAGAEELQGLFIDVGGCTTILGLDLAGARAAGTYDTRKQELAAAVAPAPRDGENRADAAEIQTYLANHGWADGTKYVILNFRDSGHAYIQKKIAQAQPGDRQGVIDGYDPVRDQIGGNHPDLDTGTEGIQQLATLVRRRGFTPVFMGEEPAGAAEPHLIRYWGFEHDHGEPPARKKLCRGGRAAEAFFIRTLAETYDVRLLSMRSGVTDQLAFLGIPTISIDVDNFHQAAVPELSDTPGYQLGDDETAHSWARGTKLEAGLERDYGRVFLSEQRELDDFDGHGKWRGEFSRNDLATIDDALGFYFGREDDEAPESNGVRHASHPFHPGKMARTEATGDSDALHGAAIGKIDTGLNPETVLAHMRAVLGADPPRIAEAVRFADSQLAFMETGTSEVAPRDVGHRAGKLAQRATFLGQVIEVLEPHVSVAKYQAELDELEELARANGPRRVRLERAVVKLRAAIVFPEVSRDDRQIVAYLSRIDAVDLDAIDAALAAAKQACAVERVDTHTARLDRAEALVDAAHTTFTDAVADGLTRHAALSYYGRKLVVARDKLAAIEW